MGIIQPKADRILSARKQQKRPEDRFCCMKGELRLQSDRSALQYDASLIAVKLVLRHVGAYSDTYRATSATITCADAVRGIIAPVGSD